MGAVRHFFPSLFFGLCPRRQALPEVDELGDVEDGLGPIVNSFQTEDNDLTTAKPKEGETSSEGQENEAEMQSAILQLQCIDDLDNSVQEALDYARGELEVLGKVWESQRIFGVKKLTDIKMEFYAKMEEILKEWTWKTSLECMTKLEAVLADPEEKQILNAATISASEELLRVTQRCRQSLEQRLELQSCLENPTSDHSRVAEAMLREGALRGRMLLEFKLRRSLSLAMTIPNPVFENVKEFQEMRIQEHSSFGERTIPSALSPF